MTTSGRDRDVAIAGLACVFPGAPDAAAYWRNIVAGRSAISERPSDRWPGWAADSDPQSRSRHAPGHSRGGFVQGPMLFDAARHRVMPAVVRDGDADQFVLLDLASQALADASVAPGDPRRARTDLIVARGGYFSSVMLEAHMRADVFSRIARFAADVLPGLDEVGAARLRAEAEAGLPARDVDRMATCIPNLVASRAANRLDLGGGAFVVDAACASALVAVEIAVDRLRVGRADLAVVAAIHFAHVPAFWHIFEELGALSPSGAMRPFDRSADGLLIAEGAGVLVLERAEDARARRHAVHAIVRGTGTSSDGASAGVLAPSSQGQVRALERAYTDAGLDPDSVGLIEAHGTATVAGDAAEIATLRSVFGPRRGRLPTRALGSVKSMIGHAMPAAGMAALIKATLAVSQAILPPSLGCSEPREDLADLPFYVNGRCRPWIQTPDRPRRAAVNAFGFGGVNAHVVIEEAPRPRSPGMSVSMSMSPLEALVPRPLEVALPRPSELLIFAAADREGLAAQVRRVARLVREDRGGLTLADVAAALTRQASAGAALRLALVRRSLEGLPEEFDALADRVAAGVSLALDADLAFGEGAASCGLVAAVFPGIGFPGLVGEFPEHLVQLCLHFPVAREVFDLVEERDRIPDDALPTSLVLAPPDHVSSDEAAALARRLEPPIARATGAGMAEVAPDARSLAHAGMLVGEWAAWCLLERLRINVDGGLGQSLGDVAAAWASGVGRFEEDVPRLWRALGHADAYMNEGRMAIVAASAERVSPRIEGLDVAIALHLSRESVILGGDEAQLRVLCAEFLGSGILAQVLPFPAVHTPKWRGVQDVVVSALGLETALSLPRFPLYSAITRDVLPADPDAIRAALHANFSQPVMFWQTLARMREDGFRTFLQVGIGTLAASARSVIGFDDVVFVGMDAAGVHPVTQIQRACAALFASGAAVDASELLAHVATTRVDLDVPRPAPIPSATAIPLTFYRPSPWRERKSGGPSDPTGEERRGHGGWPLLGRVLRHVPQEEIITELRLDPSEDRYLEDHAFLRLHGLKPVGERLPVMPLTMTLEMFAETAACLAPGLAVTAIESVRARRWIGLLDSCSLAVRVEARVEPGSNPESVRVAARAIVEDAIAAEAVIVLARHRAALMELSFPVAANTRPFPMTAKEAYAQGTLFHGPAFQCLESVTHRSGAGAWGMLRVLDRGRLFASNAKPQLILDPVVLDGAGQLLGAFFDDAASLVLPISIDRIEVLMPPPPAGRSVRARVVIEPREASSLTVSGHIEVDDGEGRPWMRVRGWRDRLFTWSPELVGYMRDAPRMTLGRRLTSTSLPPDAALFVVGDGVLRDVDPQWVARFALTRSELGALATLPQAKAREHLLARLAAKEAVRWWRAADATEAVHPLHVGLESDEAGSPIALFTDDEAPPHVSWGHGASVAVAIASRDPIGIDIELEVEGAMLRCATRACAKAMGESRPVLPGQFDVIESFDGAPSLIVESGRKRAFDVAMVRDSGHVIAVASPRAG